MKVPFAVFVILILCACGSPDGESSQPKEAVHPGKLLSQTHCGSCHMEPDPKLLSKPIWQNFILVRMGAFLGIYNDTKQYYDSLPEQWVEPGYGGERVRAGNIYPDSPKLSRQEWEQIVDYYVSLAPAQSRGVERSYPIYPELAGFQTEPISSLSTYLPYVQAIEIDPETGNSYVSLYDQSVLQLNGEGQVLGEMKGVKSVTGIELLGERITLSDMGSRFGIDNPIGKVWSGTDFKELQRENRRIELDSLQRPVYSQWVDLDQDGKEDLLVSEFGNYLGQLAWYRQEQGGQFSQHILYPDDGAIRTEVHDMNADGRPDIIALMGNGDEGIDVYLNEGEGNFRRKRVLRFLPTNGSTYFEMIDFDQDGLLDILYTQGDNGDHPPILKSHHGIRLFRNEGNLNFRQAFYLPVNGIYQASAADMDEDGDLDLVSVSYHPDFVNYPEEGFVYWENKGSAQFIASTLAEYGQGRWAAFDIGDVDQDGDLDILLGAFNAKSVDVPEERLESWLSAPTPLLLLRNTKR